MCIDYCHFNVDNVICFHYFSRLNKTLNEEVGLHKGIFTFINTMKTTIFKSCGCRGQCPKAGSEMQSSKLSARAAKAKKDYSDGTILASDLLRLIAVHYDDSAGEQPH